MVGKEHHLGLLGELREYLDPSCGPRVVVVDKEVVGEEGNPLRGWRASGAVLQDRCR